MKEKIEKRMKILQDNISNIDIQIQKNNKEIETLNFIKTFYNGVCIEFKAILYEHEKENEITTADSSVDSSVEIENENDSVESTNVGNTKDNS